MSSKTTFTVFFDGQFWVGLLELQDDAAVRAATHVFGSEPTGPELLAFSHREFLRLLDKARDAPAALAVSAPGITPNAKRAAREAARSMKSGPAAATCDSLQASRAAARADRRAEAKRALELELERKRALRTARAKARHRGKA